MSSEQYVSYIHCENKLYNIKYNCIKMREGRVNRVNHFLMKTKSMTSWSGTNNLVFVAATNAHIFLRNKIKEVFNVQVVLHFPH